MQRSSILLAVALGLTAWASRATHGAPRDVLAQVVDDLCGKQLVLLGEDRSHVAGRSIEARAEIVRRLVEQCDFDAVVFETGRYDFVELADHPDPDALRAALPMWSQGAELDGLLSFLYPRLVDGRIRLAGMDDQINQGTYAHLRMPEELVGVLTQPAQATCREAFARHAQWGYDAEHPYDSRAVAGLGGCWREIAAGWRSRGDEVRAGLARDLAGAYDRDRMQLEGADVAALFSARDEAMFEIFESLWPEGRPERIIVWLASVHAAPDAETEGVVNFGSRVHAAYGDRAFVLATSAYAGTFGRPPGRVIPPPPDGSLEAIAFEKMRGAMHYLGPAALREAGIVSAHPFGFETSHVRDWATAIDGYLVLRSESPPQHVE